MLFHVFSFIIGVVQYDGGISAFRNGWLWVDYFFVLSGVFAAKHFADYDCDKTLTLGKDALSYTVNKYKKYFGLYVVTVILLYISYFLVFASGQNNFMFPDIFSEDIPTVMSEIPYVILSLSSHISAVVSHLWFLCSMAVVLPLVIILSTRLKNIGAIFLC